MSRADDVLLRTMPPRLPQNVLDRSRVAELWNQVQDRAAVAIVAPAGYGKTTLLSQWRRRWLARGATVAWFSAGNDDDPLRFHAGLAQALRLARGAGEDAGTELDVASLADDGDDGLARLLADIAARGRRTVIALDDLQRLPEATCRQSLPRLLRHAPPNLHVLLASRAPLPFALADLAAGVATVGIDELRLQLEDSIAYLVRRFGKRLSLDECVRVHAATLGWPTGLQLAASAIEPQPDLAQAVGALIGGHRDCERWFADPLFAGLAKELGDFLVRIAILDEVDAASCRAVTGDPEAGARLRELQRDTAVLLETGADGVFRLHPLAREVLRARNERLPAAEQALLHRRACRWFAAHGRFPEAAAHALAAGDETLAGEHALRSLWALRTQGRSAEAQAWLRRIPQLATAGDVQQRLAAAWAMAIGERHADAYRIASEVMADTTIDEGTRFGAGLVASSACGYSDALGLMPELFARWPTPPPAIADPVRVLAWRNGLANLALQTGRVNESRRWLACDPALEAVAAAPLALGFRTMLLGLNQLWDGDAARAEAILRPALRRAERDGDRRSMVACLHAAVLAAAVRELGRSAEAASLLADRLDVIERTGLPDTILLAYRTLAQVALDEGDERRALALLGDLEALAAQRDLPRLAMHALAEQVRVHALQARHGTVSGLLLRLGELEHEFERREFAPYRDQYRLVAATARGHAALALGEEAEAGAQLLLAAAGARQLNRRRDVLAVQVLQAVLLRDREPAQARALLAEAEGLAAIGGCHRLLADVHPLAVKMRGDAGAADSVARSGSGESAGGVARGPMTAKETEVLRLLARGLPNKLIARALEIGPETVKWHLKNLYLKLAAGNRQHAVDRARMLGLLDD